MQAGIVVFGDRTNEGQLIQAVSLPWFEIIRELERDPRFLFALPWRKLQELVAGAYDRAGFPGSRGYKEEARLIEALPGRLRPLVVVALNTGMRRGELQALPWSDVDLAAGNIRIRRAKAGEGRWVVLNSVAREALVPAKHDQKIPEPLCVLLA